MPRELVVQYAPILSKNLPKEDDDLDARAKKALDDVARKIGRSAVNHLKWGYPAAMEAVSKNAEVSLTNHVRNQINHHMRPLLSMLIEAHKRGLLSE